MAQTVQQVINAAFTFAGITADGRAPTPTQNRKGLEVLNDNLATQQRDGWRLGWYPQTDTTNNAPLRDEDIGDVKLCLTHWVAVAYGVTIENPLMGQQILDAFDRLTKRSILFTECDLGELSRAEGSPWGGPNYI